MTGNSNTMTVAAQLEGVRALLARVNASLDRACAEHHAAAIAKLRSDKHLLEALSVTLVFLDKDQGEFARLLTVSWPKQD